MEEDDSKESKGTYANKSSQVQTYCVIIKLNEHFCLFFQLAPTPVMFMERRVLFGQVPLHLTTTRTAVLHNNSQNHAYFQVSIERALR